MPDADAAVVPADLVQLKRTMRAATEALLALPADAPIDERHRQRAAEQDAFEALRAHPAYSATSWIALQEAAVRAEQSVAV